MVQKSNAISHRAGAFLFLLATLSIFDANSLLAQGPVLFQNGVVNGASFRPPDFPGGNLAPGSIVSIFGQNLGPGEPVFSPGPNLPTQLSPQQTRVQLNDVVDCPLFYVSSGQVNCQLPPDLAGSQVRLRVITTAGQSNDITVPLGPVGLGLFTRNSNGRGPLVASNDTGDPDPGRRFQLNGPDSTARPGQDLTLWGTGLGPTNPQVPAGQPASGEAPAINQPQVFVGDRPAQLRYTGRAPGFVGLDQVNVVVPPDAPPGCAVPVRIQLGNQVSNIGTIAIHAGGLRCLDPFEDILSGTSHGSIVLHSGLGRLGRGQLGPNPGPGGPGQGMGGMVGPGPGGVGRGGIGPIGLHPGIHPHAGGLGLGSTASLGTDVVTARFVRLAGSSNLDIGIPPAPSNSCNSYFLGPFGNADLFAGPAEFLNAGGLTLNGPGVQLTLGPEPVGIGTLYVSSLPTPLTQGQYTANGLGGPDVGAFGPVNLNVPALLNITTSLAPGTVLSRQNPFTLNWTGGNTNDIVVIHGRVFQSPEGNPPFGELLRNRSQGFVCSTTVGTGQFTIPDYVLNTVPTGALALQITHMPSADGVARFNAAGLDLGGVFRWINTATYLDLVLGP